MQKHHLLAAGLAVAVAAASTAVRAAPPSDQQVARCAMFFQTWAYALRQGKPTAQDVADAEADDGRVRAILNKFAAGKWSDSKSKALLQDAGTFARDVVVAINKGNPPEQYTAFIRNCFVMANNAPVEPIILRRVAEPTRGRKLTRLATTSI